MNAVLSYNVSKQVVCWLIVHYTGWKYCHWVTMEIYSSSSTLKMYLWFFNFAIAAHILTMVSVSMSFYLYIEDWTLALGLVGSEEKTLVFNAFDKWKNLAGVCFTLLFNFIFRMVIAVK